MIQPELIERVKTNLQWLAEKMPEKFKYWISYPETFVIIHNGRAIDFIIGIDIRPDPQEMFSNSIGRIYYEAFGDSLDVFRVWNSFKVRFHPTGKFIPISLESTTELSAQLEALCIRIEQERGE